MNKTISTIIPFYNCENTLPRILDSILSGTCLPYEIILVNDGSTDGSLHIANNYAATYDCIKVLSQRHSGVSAARNLGMSISSGFWISFLDADDYVEPDMYDKMLSSITTAVQRGNSNIHRIDGCICGYTTHKEGIITNYFPESELLLSSGSLLRAMFTDDNIRGFLFNRLFRSNLIKKHSFNTEIKICEDLLFQTQLFSSQNLCFTILPEPLYHYIQSESSVTGEKNYFENGIFIYKTPYDLIRQCVKEDYIMYSYNSILDYCMYSLLKKYKQSKSSSTLSQIRSLQKEMHKTKTPLSQKSKRRLAYEHAPIIAGHFFLSY